jgi:hypothetical protein
MFIYASVLGVCLCSGDLLVQGTLPSLKEGTEFGLRIKYSYSLAVLEMASETQHSSNHASSSLPAPRTAMVQS